MIDKFLASPECTPPLRGAAEGIKASLMANQPNPKSGYRTDAKVGATKKNPAKKEKRWWLAVAPVAKPGTSFKNGVTLP